jgi:hypothetical protein
MIIVIISSFEVYFSYSVNNEPKWIYLGKISNLKPSAIFRIANLKHDDTMGVTPFCGMPGLQQSMANLAMIGISVEPEIQIDALTPATDTKTTSASSYVEFTQKMLENFFNYASSFAKDAPDGQQYFPIGTLHQWFDNFKRRLEANPNFWKS